MVRLGILVFGARNGVRQSKAYCSGKGAAEGVEKPETGNERASTGLPSGKGYCPLTGRLDVESKEKLVREEREKTGEGPRYRGGGFRLLGSCNGRGGGIRGTRDTAAGKALKGPEKTAPDAFLWVDGDKDPLLGEEEGKSLWVSGHNNSEAADLREREEVIGEADGLDMKTFLLGPEVSGTCRSTEL